MTVITSQTLAAVPGFYPLGELTGGSSYSHGQALSTDGSVAVGVSHSASGPEAFRWTAAGGMVGLGDLPLGESDDFNSAAFGVSTDGSVVVGVSDDAFRWTAAEGMVGLGDLPGGPTQSDAQDVSADGSVIVGRGRSASGPEAYRWTAGGGMVGLGDLPGGSYQTTATGISADGNTVVGYGSSSFGTEAFRWTSGGGMLGIGDLPGGPFESEARGVSGDGSVIVGFSQSAGGFRAFRWTQVGGMVSLGESTSIAADISADGSIIVGDGAGGPFVWDEAHGPRTLSSMLGVTFSDWQFLTTEGISDDGSTVIGWGRHLNGTEEAWIAVLPEPGTLGLLGIGGVLACARPARARGR